MFFKKNREPEKKAPAAEALADEMQELTDEESLKKLSGAGNPFGDRPRMSFQEIDDDLRDNG